MIRKFIVFTCAALVATLAVASDQTDALAPVNQFIDGLNKGDMKSISAAFSDEVSIVDDLAPYHWQGKGATSQWLATIADAMQKNGSTDFVMKLGKPSSFHSNGELAYAVIPATFSYKVKDQKSQGSNMITAVLHKEAVAWRITAFVISAQ